MDTKVYINVETRRMVCTKLEMDWLMSRNPYARTWEEKAVGYVKELQQPEGP